MYDTKVVYDLFRHQLMVEFDSLNDQHDVHYMADDDWAALSLVPIGSYQISLEKCWIIMVLCADSGR